MISDCILRPIFYCSIGHTVAYLTAINLAELISEYQFAHANEEGCDAERPDRDELWRAVLENVAQIASSLGITWAVYPLGESAYWILSCEEE